MRAGLNFLHASESHAYFAAGTALLGAAWEFSRLAESGLPLIVALIGGIGSILIGMAKMSSEFRAWFPEIDTWKRLRERLRLKKKP